MLCDKCQIREANVHYTMCTSPALEKPTHIDLCQECFEASDLEGARALPADFPIPLWRIALYSLIVMAGVNYFGKPEGHPILGWMFIFFAGFFIAVYCLFLNWAQTDQAHYWRLKHPGLIRSLRSFPRLLIKLRFFKLRCHR
jgi:hypothetical protein